MKGCFRNGLISLIVLMGAHGLAFGETDGAELYKQGKFKEALETFRKADMDHPKEVRFRYNRGCAAFQDADLEGAEAAFASVLKRSDDPDVRFRSLYNRGVIAFKKGDFASAVRDFKEALKINQADEDTKYNLELSLHRKTQAEEKGDELTGEREGAGDKGDNPDQGAPSQEKEGPKDTERTRCEEEKDQDERAKGEDRKAGHRENPKREGEDLSGDLAGADGDKPLTEEDPEQIPQTDTEMAKNKAEALLENVKDDRSILMEGMKDLGKQTSRSGKKW